MIKRPGVRYDDAPLRPKVVGMCWYDADTYAECYKMFEDPDSMHDNHADWLETAKATERELKFMGIKVVRVLVEPQAFREWCRKNKMKCNEPKSRTTYAATIAMETVADSQ